MTIRIPLHLFYLAVFGPVLAYWLYQLLCATWELIAEYRKKKLALLNSPISPLPEDPTLLRLMRLEASIEREIERTRNEPVLTDNRKTMYIEDEDPLAIARWMQRYRAERALLKRLEYFQKNPRFARTRIPVVVPNIDSAFKLFH